MLLRQILLLPVVMFLCLSSCQKNETEESPDEALAFEIALKWNNLFLELNRHCEGYRPPVSAQFFAYTGIAAWESATPGLPEIRSLAEDFEGLKLPVWNRGESNEFILPVALNAAYVSMTRRFFPHAPFFLKEKWQQQHREIEKMLAENYPAEGIKLSKDFGEAVANAVYEWSAQDSIGHLAFLYNYDRNFQPRSEPGFWKPTDAQPFPALLPKWGKARTFFVGTDEVQENPPLKFSENPGSPLFAQALEVYSLSKPLTKENHWVAEFWSDDLPGLTYSASARWVSITNQALDYSRPGLVKSLGIWLKIGLGMNDTAVKVWETKYKYQLERPEQYIKRNINSNWEPLHESPPFPTYPSGHSAFGGAAEWILTNELGENFSLRDCSHEHRKEFDSSPRAFGSFAEMADENAFSRIVLGVHFRMDCEEGLRIGRLIGQKIAGIKLLKNKKLVIKG